MCNCIALSGLDITASPALWAKAPGIYVNEKWIMHLVKHFLLPWKSSVTLISCSTWHFHFFFWPDIHNKTWHSETSAFYASLLQGSIRSLWNWTPPFFFLSHITSSPGTVQSLLSNPIRRLTSIFKKLIKMYRCLNPIQGSWLPSYARRRRAQHGKNGRLG